jgi:hypothetical protein
MKTKILFYVPHLSTGGMPQFLLKRIESGRQFQLNKLQLSSPIKDKTLFQHRVNTVQNIPKRLEEYTNGSTIGSLCDPFL